ncbi:hypothetical protein PGT21_020631 [Puccinia graminis f. sp. tritici]|uniref:Uncharacterized protein n=1 Tax=Puccinia graminis f. sp. tritici TaxID=56615 RepID=A0A5B0PLJ7_PUCGR|nr:hypothetical protein PGT21_020631 [Puccinia graminis f. sp. tritici]
MTISILLPPPSTPSHSPWYSSNYNLINTFYRPHQAKMVNSPPHPQQEKESGESHIAHILQRLRLNNHHHDHSNQQTNPTASDHPQPPPEQHVPSPNRISYQRPPAQPQTAW